MPEKGENMANSDLTKFRELLNTDAEFQEKLREAAEIYTGEPGDRAVFDNLLVPLAKEYGLSATFEEFTEYIGAFMRGGEKELSEDELAMVAGGKGVCFAIGGSDRPEADAYTNSEGGEAHACYYIGVGIAIPFGD